VLELLSHAQSRPPGATPSDEKGLALAVGEPHRRYTVFVAARAGWTGHLFQGRFASVAMDEDHMLAALRYVALDPVKARLAKRPQDWPWSSAGALLTGRSTPHVDAGSRRRRRGMACA
jgi:putative transposase